MVKKRIYTNLIFFFAVFLMVGIFFKGTDTGFFIAITDGFIVVSSFIFGIIVAFTMANRHSRFNALKQSLREQDALLLNVYTLSKVFNKGYAEKTRQKIEKFLVSTIDHHLIDFDKSTDLLNDLHLFLAKSKTRNKVQEQAKSNMLNNMDELTKIGKRISYNVKSKMMVYEWVSLITLACIIIFSLFYVSTGSIVSTLIVSALSTSLVLFLFIIKELNDLHWQELEWLWLPLGELFIDLRLIPYFPEDIFNEGRVKIKKLAHLKKVRVAHYIDPYPVMKNKQIETIEMN